MTEVFRLAQVRGNVLSGPWTGGLGGWWIGGHEVARCARYGHDAPAPRCQCGIWATPSRPSLAQFIRDWRFLDDCRVAQVRDALRGATREQIRDAVGEIGSEHSFSHLGDMTVETLIAAARDLRWQNIAIVRAQAEGPGLQMYDNEPGLWPGNDEYLQLLGGFMRVGRTAALEWSARLNHPVGFCRYQAATITGVWLDSRWSDYTGEMADRYGCRVRSVQPRSRRHDWISEFELAGVLPGVRSSPDPEVIGASLKIMGVLR